MDDLLREFLTETNESLDRVDAELVLDLQSAAGVGTAFTIKIPLTLAIVSSLLVEAGGERFAMPQLSVLELVQAGNGEHRIERIKDTPVLRLRKKLLPLIYLKEMLRLGDRASGDCFVLAEHLKGAAGRDAHEGEDGEPVLAGGIYVAPGGRHMRVVRGPGGVRIALGDDPPINFCKPAVDALFSSAAAAWGAGNLALVLTGMGTDGTRGAADLVAAGGSVIAQDEATSVVWGMPRSVAQAGLCSAVLPLDQIAANVTRLFFGDRQ